jgi:GTP cyclohydrolase I
MKKVLPDVQNSRTDDFPKIKINKVGVRNIEYPITIKREGIGDEYHTDATFSSYCNLTADVAGINMSRISRTIFEVFKETDFVTKLSERCVRQLQDAHEQKDAYLKTKFKYKYEQTSPSTELYSPETANVFFETYLKDSTLKNFLTVEIVGMSLCPCSKEMSLFKNNMTSEEKDYLDHVQDEFPDLWNKIMSSGFGAHNQKSKVSVKVELIPDVHFPIDEIIDVIRNSVSCEVYSVLKRPDEKYVTEVSYMSSYINETGEIIPVENGGPKFVEDISRQVADRLNLLLDTKINDYVIVVRNEESIHSNAMEAVAILSAGRSLV